MSEDQGAPAPTMIKSVHIVGVVSRAISTDGQAAMIVFQVAPETEGAEPREFAITIPTAQLKWITSIFHECAVQAEGQGRPPGQSHFQFPSGYSIGSSPNLPHHVVLQFDRDKPTESTFVVSNLSGLEIAAALRKDINPRLTMEERRHMQTMPSLRSDGPKIIMPDR